MAYSMPLWTIFAKWPAPTVAGVHEAGVALGLERVEDRLHLGDVARRSRRTSARSRSPGPRRRRRRRSRRSRCPSRRAASACSWSSVQRELPPSTTRSPSPSSSPSSSIVSRVGSPAGTITQTTFGARAAASTSVGEAADVGDVGVAVVADDRVPGVAQPVAHVAAHLAETDETDVHAQSLLECRVSSRDPTCSTAAAVRRRSATAGAAASAGSGSRGRRSPSSDRRR